LLFETFSASAAVFLRNFGIPFGAFERFAFCFLVYGFAGRVTCNAFIYKGGDIKNSRYVHKHQMTRDINNDTQASSNTGDANMAAAIAANTTAISNIPTAKITTNEQRSQSNQNKANQNEVDITDNGTTIGDVGTDLATLASQTSNLEWLDSTSGAFTYQGGFNDYEKASVGQEFGKVHVLKVKQGSKSIIYLSGSIGKGSSNATWLNNKIMISLSVNFRPAFRHQMLALCSPSGADDDATSGKFAIIDIKPNGNLTCFLPMANQKAHHLTLDGLSYIGPPM
jgi:hypothetical protein